MRSLQAEISIEEAAPVDVASSFELLWGLLFEGFDQGASILNYHKNIGTKALSPLHAQFLQLCKKSPLSLSDYQQSIEKIERFKLNMNKFIEDYDFILCPPCANVAYEHGKTFAHLPDFSYAMTYNLTGWPAVVVPVGHTQEGLPIGIQVVAKPWHDHVALAVANQIENLCKRSEEEKS